MDVAWFGQAYKGVTPARWKQMYDFAKFACTGVGHKRAQLFADAMLGEAGEGPDGEDREDAEPGLGVVLGLVPLEGGEKREADILERYTVMQEFLRGGKSFGAEAGQRAAGGGDRDGQPARQAGYADPVRLQWAMEAVSCRDWRRGR